MPIYDSKCNKCNSIKEYSTKISERDNTPECCGEKTERVLLKGPIGFVDNLAFMSNYKKLY